MFRETAIDPFGTEVAGATQRQAAMKSGTANKLSARAKKEPR
jgi:hypothetical protein